MIPMALVTGFLGAGKTTFLEQVLVQYADRKLAYLVNEFSPVDVDGTRLDLPEGRGVTIAGGSIFCKCKVTDFLRELKTIAPLNPEGIVIEASGMADPLVVERMLTETKMDQMYRLACVVAVVDPGSFPKLLKTLPNVTRQVECADVVLVNKTDLYPADAVDATVEQVRTIRSEVAVLKTVKCQAAVDLLGERESVAAVDAEYPKCVDPNFTRADVALEGRINWPKLQKALDEACANWYRIKGAVPVEGGLLSVDFSASGWQERKAAGRERGALVMIGSRDTQPELAQMVNRIRSGEFAA